MSLLRLPTGQWIDPATITAIVPLARHKCEFTGWLHAPRVVIHTSHTTIVINCDEYDQAQSIADELAALAK